MEIDLAGKRGATGSIGLTLIRELAPHTEVFDAGKGAVSGFGARRRAGEAVTYFVFYRTAQGRQRRYTIGRHGAPWTPDTARSKAVQLLGEVAAGKDPAATKFAKRNAATIAELCDDYLTAAQAGEIIKRDGRAKKATTLASDKGRIESHIKPLLGHIAVDALTKADVELFMRAIAAGKTAKIVKTKLRGLSITRGGKGTATRSMGTLGAILTYAVSGGLRSDNPAHHVRKYAENRRERRLSYGEYSLVGMALGNASTAKLWPPAIACARFLLLTGWRSGEALALRWDEVDLARRTVILGDSKSGRSMRPLSKAAAQLLEHQRGTGLVFKPSRGGNTMSGFGQFWDRIATLGALPSDISPHVLRHSFASLAADLGYSEPTIGALIGHKGRSVTSRYVHAADAVLLDAADVIAERIIELLETHSQQSS